jgi:hypothetical protein
VGCGVGVNVGRSSGGSITAGVDTTNGVEVSGGGSGTGVGELQFERTNRVLNNRAAAISRRYVFIRFLQG